MVAGELSPRVYTGSDVKFQEGVVFPLLPLYF